MSYKTHPIISQVYLRINGLKFLPIFRGRVISVDRLLQKLVLWGGKCNSFSSDYCLLGRDVVYHDTQASNQRTGKNFCLQILRRIRKWRQQSPSKLWYFATKVYVVTLHKVIALYEIRQAMYYKVTLRHDLAIIVVVKKQKLLQILSLRL
jgi:hypothetical protein